MPTPSLPEIQVTGGDGPGPLPPDSPLAPEARATGAASTEPMDPRSPEAYGADASGAEGWAEPHLREQLWWVLGTLYRRRWWIVAIVILAGGLSVWYALSLENRYRAETRVLLPEKSDAFGGLLDSVVPGASAILGGGGGGGYTRYLAILTSQSTMQEMVDEFDLVEVYQTQEKANPRDAAVGELFENTGFEVSLEYDYLGVSVLDKDPRRAARMANAFVALLNRRHIAFQSGSAEQDREFLETRLQEAQVALDSSLNELQAFQERYGIMEPESQGEAFMGAIAEATGQVAQADVQYQALRSQYGDENPDVSSARAALNAARSNLNSLTEGREKVLPVPIGQLPAVGRRYAQIYQELATQKQIVEALRPLYEQAALSERRDADAVQVLDVAVPPSRKAEPRRSILVLSATFAAGVLAVLVILLVSWWRRQRQAILARLRASA